MANKPPVWSASKEITGRPNERLIVGGAIGFGWMNAGDAPGLTAKSGYVRIVEKTGAVQVCLMKFETYFDFLENAYKNALVEKLRMENENNNGISNGNSDGTVESRRADRIESSDTGI